MIELELNYLIIYVNTPPKMQNNLSTDVKLQKYCTPREKPKSNKVGQRL
jgi:hypothetical protein